MRRMAGFQGTERRGGVRHHVEFGGVYRMASVAQLQHNGEFLHPAASIHHRRMHRIRRSISATFRIRRTIGAPFRYRRRALGRDVPVGRFPHPYGSRL